MDRREITERAVQKSLKILESEYAEARQDKVATLHNKMVDALTQVGASPQDALLVLEVLRQEVLQSCLAKFFAKIAQPPRGENLSEKVPSTIQGNKVVRGKGGTG